MREDRTLFLFVFRSDAGAIPSTQTEIRDVLRSEFGDLGWEAPGILDALDSVEDIYFDRMSQIRMPSWTRGRVALVGDAAAAVSLLAGEGTGLAMVETYALAGELGQASGDYRRAFSEYERRLRPFVEHKQKTAARFASSFVPETELGIWARNQATKLMHIPGVAVSYWATRSGMISTCLTIQPYSAIPRERRNDIPTKSGSYDAGKFRKAADERSNCLQDLEVLSSPC